MTIYSNEVQPKIIDAAENCGVLRNAYFNGRKLVGNYVYGNGYIFGYFCPKVEVEIKDYEVEKLINAKGEYREHLYSQLEFRKV